jgi:hypothetical protein
MPRLTESQLAGFRVGTSTDSDRPRPQAREPAKPRREARTDQPALELDDDTRTTDAGTTLGRVPAAPARSDPRHKIGITLPAELAANVRSIIKQGYALADLVMVAYREHRDDLVREHATRTTRQLVRRKVGRGSFTVTLSVQERDALDALARRLDATRSHTVAAVIERYLPRAATDTTAAYTEEPQ